MKLPRALLCAKSGTLEATCVPLCPAPVRTLGGSSGSSARNGTEVAPVVGL